MPGCQNKQTNQNSNYQTTQISLGIVELIEVKQDLSLLWDFPVYLVQYALKFSKKEHIAHGVSQAYLIMKNISFFFF